MQVTGPGFMASVQICVLLAGVLLAWVPGVATLGSGKWVRD